MPHPIRADILGGHLILLRLAEQIPEIELRPDVRVSLGEGDAIAVAQLDQLAAALTAHGIPFTEENTAHHRKIRFTAGAVSYAACHVWDKAMDDYYARVSYTDNVKIDPSGASA